MSRHRGKARPAIEALLGVPVQGVRATWRHAPERRVWRVVLRRGKSITVDLADGAIRAERWGIVDWTPMAVPSAAKTVRDIYASGDDGPPESAEGARRATVADYLAWRRRTR